MADELATDTGALTQQLEQLREQLQTSYEQTGLSDQTRQLLERYVDGLVQAGRDVSSSSASEQQLVEEITALLDPQVTEPAVVEAIERQLADLAAGKHCANGGPAQRNVEKGADPIEMFSGQFTQDETDLAIDGAGMSFVFSRVYKSQAVFNGPLGANWDHSYNLYLRRQGDNVVRSSGELREDVYTRHPRFGQNGFNYWAPPDGRHGVIEETNTSFSWRSPIGVRYLYEPDPADPLFHRIQEIRDRFGNYLAFTYQDDRLERVEINHPSRFVVFEYDTARRLVTLRDHVDQRWSYAYDDYGDLIAVTSPRTDRYPLGLTTTYEYSSGEDSAPLRHNLLRIIDPSGQLYLENEYGTDPGLLAFNRVIRQRQGAGEYRFEYESVIDEFEFDYSAAEKPAIQVNHVLRHGQMIHLVYNAFGNLLFQEEYVWHNGSRRLVQWRYRYNRDGALVGTITPEGGVMQCHYGRDDYLLVHNIDDDEVTGHDDLTAAARMAFGNLLAVVRRGRRYNLAQMNLNRGVWGDFFPDVLASVDPDDVVVKNTYEPDYQQILTASDPRFTDRADPRYPEAASYTSHLTRYEYGALPLKTLSRIRYPDTTFPSPLPDGTTGLVDTTEEYLQYDARGRLERMCDAMGTITAHAYFAAGHGTKDGYLCEVVHDVNALALTTSYDVNDVGMPVKVVNPRGTQTTAVVNELNQIIETTSGLGYRLRSFFNRCGLLERQTRDNIDDAGEASPDGDETRTYRYDEQNNLIRETRGGADLSDHRVTRHRYDCADKRVETIRPCGNSVRYRYDERLMLKSAVRGRAPSTAAETRVVYDGDRRRTAAIDGRGNVTRFAYDALDRVIHTIDPLGHVQQNAYDKLGNVTIFRTFARRADGTYELLKRGEREYDERGNRIREIDCLFNAPMPTADIWQSPDREFAAARHQGLVTMLTTELFYDANKRLLRQVNPKGQERTWEYDTAGRRVLERDNAGHYVLTSYDPNANVVRVDRHELVRDPLTGALVREDVFSTIHDYDAVDRRTATTDGLGNRTTFSYDSLNNLASVTDPLGNVTRYRYDVLSRKVREIVEMTETGLGGGARLPDVVTQFIYDDNDRLTSVVDANGNTTMFAYDELDRVFQTTYADGSIMRSTYDRDDNVVVQRDSNGLQQVYHVDPMGRRIRMDLDRTLLDPAFAYPAVAETYESYVYDAAGRMIRQNNDFCSIDYTNDSLDRVYDERFQFTTPYAAPAGILTLGRSFDDLSYCTRMVYPSGRAIQYERDDVNRIRSITSTSNGVGYPGSAAFAVPYDIARYQYRGRRLSTATYGNGTGYGLSYDAASRVIGCRHVSGTNVLLELQQLWDGAGNRRLHLSRSPGVAQPQGEVYSYDSLYRLTRHERRPTAAAIPAIFEPPNAPLPRNALTGQVAIDNAIGVLAQDPLDYTYQYDALGNRERERLPGQPQRTYVANALNQYETVAGTRCRHDLNGNLIDDGVRIYRYNYRNQLVQVLDAGANTEILRQLHDASGRLVVVAEAGPVAHLINDGPNVVEEYDGNTAVRQYVNEGGTDERCQLASGGEEWWYHVDVQGSTRLLSDSAGHVSANAAFNYDPFGSTVAPIVHSNPYYFTGKRVSAAGDLYESRARQYSPVLGRFLQRDPAGFGDGLNLYTYCGNNPASAADRLGMEKRGTAPGPVTEAQVTDVKLAWVEGLVARGAHGCPRHGHKPRGS